MRYTAARKAEIVALVYKHPAKRLEIMKEHNLSEEELSSMERYLELRGISGLRATKLQETRKECGDARCFK